MKKLKALLLLTVLTLLIIIPLSSCIGKKESEDTEGTNESEFYDSNVDENGWT